MLAINMNLLPESLRKVAGHTVGGSDRGESGQLGTDFWDAVFAGGIDGTGHLDVA